MRRIAEKLEELQNNPFPHDMKRIEGDSLFRIRVGKVRILYEVDYVHKQIGIVKIDKRERVYE